LRNFSDCFPAVIILHFTPIFITQMGEIDGGIAIPGRACICCRRWRFTSFSAVISARPIRIGYAGAVYQVSRVIKEG
jgi:hypothetical protein